MGKVTARDKLLTLICVVGLVLAACAPHGERRLCYAGILILIALDPLLETVIGLGRYPRTRARSLAYELSWLISLTGMLGNWLPSDPKTAVLLVLNLTGLSYYAGIAIMLFWSRGHVKTGQGGK